MHRWRGADEVSPSLLHPLLVVVSVEVERLLFPLGLSQFDLFLDDARELFRVDAIVEIQSDGGRSSEDDAQQYRYERIDEITQCCFSDIVVHYRIDKNQPVDSKKRCAQKNSWYLAQRGSQLLQFSGNSEYQ